MEARIYRAAIIVVAFFAMGASHRTPNFIISAPTPEFARQVGDAAEKYRRELAVHWIGQELPRWAEPCPINLQVGPNLGAGGATSFVFDRGEVFGWQMNIQGSEERLLDSVLPHEITHTIFASYYRRPLPRWADEGACTTVEHEVERRKQQQMLIQFLKTGRGIPFSKMFLMRDYPADVMPLYSQGYSLCRYLIQQGGRKKFVDFVAEGMRDENWTAVTKRYYGHQNLGELQTAWVDWVRNGSPMLDLPEQLPGQDNTLLVSNDQKQRPTPNLIYRGQSSDTASAPRPGSFASVVPAPLASNSDSSANVSHPRSATLSYPKDSDLTQPQAKLSLPGPAAAPAVALPSPVAMTAPNQTPAQTAASATNSAQAGNGRQVLLEWSRGAGPNDQVDNEVDEQGRPLPPPPASNAASNAVDSRVIAPNVPGPVASPPATRQAPRAPERTAGNPFAAVDPTLR